MAGGVGQRAYEECFRYGLWKYCLGDGVQQLQGQVAKVSIGIAYHVTFQRHGLIYESANMCKRLAWMNAQAAS